MKVNLICKRKLPKGHASVITGNDPVRPPFWLPPRKLILRHEMDGRIYGLMKANEWFGEDSNLLSPLYNDHYFVVASWAEYTDRATTWTKRSVISTDGRRTHVFVENRALGELVFNAIKELKEELLAPWQ